MKELSPTATLDEDQINRIRVVCKDWLGGLIVDGKPWIDQLCDLALKGLRAEAATCATCGGVVYVRVGEPRPDCNETLPLSATTSAGHAEDTVDILVDSERYRWFRDHCDQDRRIEILEASEGIADLIDHHIDKGRCGL